MDLPNLFNRIANNQQEPQKFIAIEIGLDAVKVALWQSDGQHTEVISIGSVQSCTAADEEELLTAIDTSLADALGSLPDEPDQVIFGLPDAWVEDNNTIVDSKKALLKAVCKKFSFRPIGFVITTVAISHYLRDTEGGASSYILVQLSPGQLVVSLIHSGHLESTQTIDRSTNLAADIEEALAKIPHRDNLPARIIYSANQEDPEPIKQELLAYEWQKKLAFLHVPKVESLPKEWSIKAISISGGSEVIQSIGIKSTPVEPPPDLGFKPVSFNPADVSPAELDNVEPAILTPPLVETEPEPEPEPELQPPAKKFTLPQLHLPRLRFPSFSGKLVLPAIIFAAVVILAVAGFFAYRRLPSATINIDIAMNPYQQQINFLIDPNISATDFESNILAGTTATVDVSGSKTIPTTGSKLVGDRAKGKVIIYNRTSAPKNFKAGTVIKANKLQFTLDTNVTVASASSKENADFSLTIEPSKVESMATAADIGSQYNLAKDTQFSVENYASDTFFAVAESTFSGGSSQTVAAVSVDDLANLKSALIKELQDQLAPQTSSGSAASQGQISIGEPKVNEEQYSAAKNEAAAELSLNLSLSQLVYKYDQAELSVIAQTAAAKSLPTNAQIRPDSTQVNILSSKTNDNGQADVTAQVVLYHIPRLETNDIVNSMVNAKLDDIETKLSVIPGFQQYQLTQSKLLLFKRLPPTAAQISLRIIPVAKDQVAP